MARFDNLVPTRDFWRSPADWPARRWLVAAGVAALTVVVTAVPTAMIPTPFFGREIPTTAWAWPVLIVTSILAGLVAATYVARRDVESDDRRASRFGLAGAVVTFFAVGCPVCNKLVLVVLGYTGAMQYFAPVQPILAVTAVVLLAWALAVRLSREKACVAG